MIKNKGFLFANGIFMVAELFYILITMFALNAVDVAKESTGRALINILYISVIFLMILCSFVSYRKKSEKIFYMWKSVATAILIIGELIILSDIVYLKAFLGLPLIVSIYSYRKS